MRHVHLVVTGKGTDDFTIRGAFSSPELAIQFKEKLEQLPFQDRVEIIVFRVDELRDTEVVTVYYVNVSNKTGKVTYHSDPTLIGCGSEIERGTVTRDWPTGDGFWGSSTDGWEPLREAAINHSKARWGNVPPSLKEPYHGS